MALIARLLNGDLNNYGIGAVTVTNHGATVDNSCKTGKGYSFSNTYIDVTIPSVTGNFTITWWEFSSDFNGGTMPWGIQLFNPFFCKCLNTGDGLSNPWYKPGTTTAIDNLANSVWHHFAVTSNGSTNYLYVDGILYGQSNTHRRLNSTSLRFNGWPHDTDYKRNGKMCDWRLYNTCLSADQIKEISRGMVLHYKMCQPERSRNYFGTEYSKGQVIRLYDYSSDGSFTQFYNMTVPMSTFAGKQMTFSYDVKCESGTSEMHPLYNSNGDPKWLIQDVTCPTGLNISTKWKKLIFKFTVSADRGPSFNSEYSNKLEIYCPHGRPIYVRNMKLEEGWNDNPQWTPTPESTNNWGTIEYDGSGFKNHSSSTANIMPVLVADSPRYTGSYRFAGNSSQLNIPITKMSGYTICFWRKGTATETWLPLGNNLSNKWLGAAELSGSYATIYHGNCSCGTCYVDGVAATTYPRDNNWHFYCYTNVTLDWDGVWLHGYGGYRPTDYWSDFRIYATALDATAVAELYKLGR